VEQADILYRKLLEAGVDASLVIVENANHNFKPTGAPIEPTRAEISRLIGDFFDQKLK
jgi:dipeptidyl aminopeptidase/acylaminoacyl peptidase